VFKTQVPFFSEHQITEDGVQIFSLKTVTLQNLEQFLKLVNFMGIVQKSDGVDFEQFWRGVQKVVQQSGVTVELICGVETCEWWLAVAASQGRESSKRT
jgi:hypothetical protein